MMLLSCGVVTQECGIRFSHTRIGGYEKLQLQKGRVIKIIIGSFKSDEYIFWPPTQHYL